MATAELATAAAAITLQTFLSPIPEVSTIKILSTYILVNLAAVAWSLRASILADIPPPPSIAWLNLVFLSTATSWTVIHRLYFSPLASLPGPKRAAVSRLWVANQCRLGRSAAYLEEIHEEYNADIVRVGPNEVSIIDVEAIQEIYKGQYPRGYFYELRASMGERNLNSERDYTHHGEWRRLWEKALSAKELVNYDGRLQHHVEKFLRLLKNSEGRDVNTIKLTERFQVDV
ncbi:hypothetical protein AtubIFM55763_003186 [Aspergillus tubingensis]|nr:hypothetical protein AtubIFM54640_008272 [Aspergillus tubingensis]GLA68121.1 hypothetical protein AtubIFM55763_003186 [Aspergillus tubingensis]GLA86341.1 hypothetical protein AtubIFM56815_010601 [Aspergillus tubingensis]GLA95229.1 hypothetical protein AtubIFM57143_002234 [Aspergillus tubingensis]GLB19771.1 hypothetical protein AtubIFM61612_009688 [Aspergillus tubingensis]